MECLSCHSTETVTIADPIDGQELWLTACERCGSRSLHTELFGGEVVHAAP